MTGVFSERPTTRANIAQLMTQLLEEEAYVPMIETRCLFPRPSGNTIKNGGRDLESY